MIQTTNKKNMRTLFDIKTPVPFDSDVFEKMRASALEVLKDKKTDRYAQVIVALTENGNEHCIFVPNAMAEEKTVEKALIEKLIAESDTVITHLLCLWHDGEYNMDIPSFDFRILLLDMNETNLNTKIFVNAANGPSTILLRVTVNK